MSPVFPSFESAAFPSISICHGIWRRRSAGVAASETFKSAVTELCADGRRLSLLFSSLVSFSNICSLPPACALSGMSLSSAPAR